MPQYFVRTLIIPLSLATVVSLAIGIFVPWQGLFVNLATSFFSVLITIIYVDRVLQEHDRRIWSNVSAFIRDRVNKFGYAITLEIRVVFGLDARFAEMIIHDVDSEEKVKQELTRFTEEIVNPSVFEKVSRMDNNAWKSLAHALEELTTQGDNLINLYGNKLQPELLQTILDIQTKASWVLSQYYVIPDLVGVPDAHLKSKTPGVASAYIKLLYQNGSNAICEINRLALKLINLP